MTSARGLWVFGYGSLMWQPGFAHDEAVRATLHGGHRALCVYSYVYRGTPRHPGLVLGLDVGGQCEGMAFHVPPERADAAIAYLRRREQVTNVYHEMRRPVLLQTQPRREVLALCYAANRRHRQYAGALPLETQAALVRYARGMSGRDIDYVLNTARHLRALGIADRGLEAVAARLGKRQEPVHLAGQPFNFRH